MISYVSVCIFFQEEETNVWLIVTTAVLSVVVIVLSVLLVSDLFILHNMKRHMMATNSSGATVTPTSSIENVHKGEGRSKSGSTDQSDDTTRITDTTGAPGSELRRPTIPDIMITGAVLPESAAQPQSGGFPDLAMRNGALIDNGMLSRTGGMRGLDDDIAMLGLSASLGNSPVSVADNLFDGRLGRSIPTDREALDPRDTYSTVASRQSLDISVSEYRRLSGQTDIEV